MDFDTTKGGNEDRSRGGFDFSTGRAEQASRGRVPGSPRAQRHRRRAGGAESEGRQEDFRVPGGSRKAVLVHLALAAWRTGKLDPKELGEVRGRKVDEAGLQRALYRSSIGEIEHVLGPTLKGRCVVVGGRLAGTGRTALERLGAEVEELRSFVRSS